MEGWVCASASNTRTSLVKEEENSVQQSVEAVLINTHPSEHKKIEDRAQAGAHNPASQLANRRHPR